MRSQVPRPLRVPYHHSAKIICHPVAGQSQLAQPEDIRDISRTGISLILPLRFEPGTVLTVDLQSADQAFARTGEVQVIHAQGLGSGHWLLGCAFTQGLSDRATAILLTD